MSGTGEQFVALLQTSPEAIFAADGSVSLHSSKLLPTDV